MAASVTSERPGKRDRLVTGARETIYRHGVEATTIADIAEASDVPVGNVYYYFTNSSPRQSTPTPKKAVSGCRRSSSSTVPPGLA